MTIRTLFSAALTLCALSSAPLVADEPSLQSLIDSAITSGATELKLPPGEYPVTPPREPGPHLTIKGAKKLSIDATDVRVVATTLNQVLRIEDCSDLTIKGLTIDYDPLPFTQGQITAISDDGASFDVKLHAGYRTAEGRVKGITIDPKTRIVKDDTWTRYSGAASDAGEGVVRVDWGRPIKDATAVGDLVVLTVPTRSPHGIQIINCENLTLDGVTVHASTSFAILENSCTRSTYRNVRVVPGPTPAGATEPRLLASNADGIHSKHASVGPTIENCQLIAMGDDGIAINGDFGMVVRSSGDTTAIIAPTRGLTFQVGDHLRGFDEHLVPTAQATITAIRKVDPTGDNDPKPVQQRRLPELRGAEHLQKETYEITLDRKLGLAAGYLVSSPQRNGSGFVIRNNTIRDHRARGMLIKASNGVIEGNTIEGSVIAGIVLSPEANYWLEADYSQDVVIRNNTIRRVGRGARNPGIIQAGAISVVADSRGAADGHRDIVIDSNTIEDAAGCNVMIMSANGVTVTNNRFVRPGHVKAGSGKNHGVDGSAVVWINQAQNVVLSGNTTVDPGPETKSDVVATPSTSDVVTK